MPRRSAPSKQESKSYATRKKCVETRARRRFMSRDLTESVTSTDEAAL
jgi:hypothetical protein